MLEYIKSTYSNPLLHELFSLPVIWMLKNKLVQKCLQKYALLLKCFTV